MNRLRSLIIESLQTPKKKDCNCGCGGCSTGNLGPILNENKAFINPLSTDLQYHIDNNRPLTEHLYRAGSDSYFALFAEARNLYSRNVLKISNTDAASGAMVLSTETRVFKNGKKWKKELMELIYFDLEGKISGMLQFAR